LTVSKICNGSHRRKSGIFGERYDIKIFRHN
jgi:hypothetical protein